MFGSRFFSFVIIALAGSSVVAAMAGGPIAARSPGSGAVEAIATKRQASTEAQVLDVMANLKTTVDPILASIDTVVSSGVITGDAVYPLVEQVTAALDAASASLAAIEPGTSLSSLMARQTNDEVANLVAGIVKSIATTLNALLPSLSTLPLLGGLLTGVDTSLNQVLKGLEILLAGVLNLVANLLTNVAQLLRNLAFVLTLSSLGF